MTSAKMLILLSRTSTPLIMEMAWALGEMLPLSDLQILRMNCRVSFSMQQQRTWCGSTKIRRVASRAASSTFEMATTFSGSCTLGRYFLLVCSSLMMSVRF